MLLTAFRIFGLENMEGLIRDPGNRLGVFAGTAEKSRSSVVVVTIITFIQHSLDSSTSCFISYPMLPLVKSLALTLDTLFCGRGNALNDFPFRSSLSPPWGRHNQSPFSNPRWKEIK